MNPISNLFLVLVLGQCPFQILAQNPTPKSETNPLIIETCKQTLFNDLCKTVLQSEANSNVADLYNLTKMALKITLENATNAYESITNMHHNSSDTDPFVEQCLADCSENYQDAIDQLDDSLTALDFKAYNDVTTWLAAAMADAETCEDGFKEKQGYHSPITQINTVFNQLCSISLSITTQLAGK